MKEQTKKKTSNQIKRYRTKKEEDEIVNRHLLQKIFCKWQIYTFGKPTPSDANKYYQKKLLVHCMNIWQDTHLSERKEWKLDIRAEYHDRYRRWTKCFAAWKEYTIKQRNEKLQLAKAVNHANKALYRKTFQNLKGFEKYKLKKSRQINKADEFHQNSLIRRAWKDWLFQLNNKCLMKHLQYISLSHWAFTLRKQMFKNWRKQYLEACQVNDQLKFSESYYNNKQIKLIFNAWKEYRVMRKAKNSFKGKSLEHYNENLRTSTFQRWKKHLLHIQKLKAHERQIIEMGNRAIKRRYLVHWIFFLEIRKIRDEQNMITDNFCCRKKKIIALIAWKNFTTNSKSKKIQQEQAENFRSIKILSLHLKKWMDRVEEEEDEKMNSLFQIADNYYRNQLYSKLIYAWLQYVKETKLTKQKLKIAANHFDHKLLPRYFTLWKHFVLIHQEVTEKKQISAKFRMEIIYAKYFYQWLKLYRMEEKSIEMHKEASNHEEFTILRRYFNSWKEKFEYNRIHSEMEVKSLSCYKSKIYSQYFMKWKTAWNTKLKSAQKRCLAERHYDVVVIKKCWHAIRKYHDVCQKRKREEIKADHYSNCYLLKKVLRSWKDYTESSKVKKKTADNMYTLKMDILLRWSLMQWRDFILEQKKEGEMNTSADQFHQRWLLIKCFNSLKQYASLKIDQRFWDSEATIRTQIRIDKGLLMWYFKEWKEKAVVKRQENILNRIACEQYDDKLKKRVVFAFKVNVHEQLRKKVLVMKSKKFYVTKLETQYLRIWLTKYRDRLEEHRKTNIALIWWSFQLQRKVLHRLQEYKDRSLKKKKEYQNALLFHKQLLIEKGLEKWFSYANASMERRRRIAYAEQMKQCMALQGRVRRYAMHWLRITQRRVGLSKSKENSNKYISTSPITFDGITVNETIDAKPIFGEIGYSSNARFKKFDTNFPSKRKRPTPRRPDYLRESYDLKNFSNTSGSANNHPSESQPRCGIQHGSTHAHSDHPLLAAYETLELSAEENRLKKTFHLIAPSEFT